MTETERTGAVLVNVSSARDEGVAPEELESLAHTAGYEVRAYLTQRRATPDKSFYIGKGKLDELKSVVEATDSSVVIFENEVGGTQLNNLENALGVTVMDRSTLIIEIFARHATTNEGKLQVELMKKKKQLPRVLGQGVVLSRQGGGGAGGGGARRGGGEQQQEIDKRSIRREIRELEKKLDKLEAERAVRRERRTKNAVKVVSLVGYTNAGKSSLMNVLTKAGVGVEDKLFATLDPVVRKLRLDGGDALLVDTVGFISDLPHDFVRAFRSTLEETVYSDLLLHVVDSSDVNCAEQYAVVNDVLEKIGASHIPAVVVLNKCDRLSDDAVVPGSERSIRTSATLKLGIDELKELINEMLFGGADAK